MNVTASLQDLGAENAPSEPIASFAQQPSPAREEITEAQNKIEKAKQRSGWIFLGTWIVLSVAAVLAIAALNDWRLLEDFRSGFLGAQWPAYREMLLAIVGSAAAAKAFAQHFVLSVDTKAVEQIVRSSEKIIIEYRTRPGDVDPRFTNALVDLNTQVKVLETKLDADPELKRQLTDFLSYARDQKIEQQRKEITELKQQLATDAALFDGFRSALSKTAAECDRAAHDSKLRSA